MSQATIRPIADAGYTPDATVTAEQVAGWWRDYAHLFVDELFEWIGAEDVIGDFYSAITFRTWARAFTGMIIEWGEIAYDADGEDCHGPGKCSNARCLVHNMPDLCVPFRPDAELRGIFTRLMNRRPAR